jgi:stage II sporulation protein D
VNWIRHPMVRTGYAGIITLTTVSVNLLPAMAGVQAAREATSLRLAQMGGAIDGLGRAAIPIKPISVAANTVQPKKKPAKTVQKTTQSIQSRVEQPADLVSDSGVASNPNTSPQLLTQSPELAQVQPAQPSVDVAAPLTIRVQVGDTLSQRIEFAASTETLLNAGDQSFQIAPNTLYAAAADSQGLRVGNMTVDILELDPGPDGYVFVNNRWYLGKLQLVWSENGILTINELPLESYLYSVVGAEMPSNWNPEALKAQAVAARSYAIAHLERPAADWFDLGDDERWQAYRGGETMSEASIAAVQETLGQVLSQNGQVFEAQYAATEAISQEAHGGVGMSQHGAQDLAEAGNDYLQILGHYYAGTAIALMQ